MRQHFDVLVVGGGLSGISAGYRLMTECPGKTFAILEARQALGGTWDLFRYPGVRSDSDMVTLGFPFRPWTKEKVIVEGDQIRSYIVDTARELGIDQKVRFGHRVTAADWCSTDKQWRVQIQTDDQGELSLSCSFLFMGSGYYDYQQGYTPDFPGAESFRGSIVHPQHWPEDLLTEDKRIVVIGSGATAISLIPALAKTARQVTMLQRSPSYVVGIPSRDGFTRKLRRYLPSSLVTRLARWRSVLIASVVFWYARLQPAKTRSILLERLARYFTPEEIAEHFTPRYAPWDQRLCFAPDSDLFKALKTDSASIVTAEIEAFTESGILLQDGRHLEADIIVTATGLVVQLFGGAKLSLDGRPIRVAEHVVYKGMMLDGVPNLALAIGYTNMSWTLKCDLTARYVCRLLQYLDQLGYREGVPQLEDEVTPRSPLLDFSSGYVTRAANALPSQGAKAPWRVRMSYWHDQLQLRFGRLDDGVMRFR